MQDIEDMFSTTDTLQEISNADSDDLQSINDIGPQRAASVSVKTLDPAHEARQSAESLVDIHAH